MYRKNVHYIYATIALLSFFSTLPHGRDILFQWVNGGWKDSLYTIKTSVNNVKNDLIATNSNLVQGKEKDKQWRASSTWVRYISPGTSYSTVYPIKVIKWIDGDTLDVIYNQKIIRVRLIGVDTLETKMNSKMAHDSSEYNKSPSFLMRLGGSAYRASLSFIPNGSNAGISFDGNKPTRGKYGRILAYIHNATGYVINEELIKKGYAKVWAVNSKNTAVYKVLEAKARLSHAGIWKYID